MYMANANQTRVYPEAVYYSIKKNKKKPTHIPNVNHIPLARDGSAWLCVGSARVCIGSAMLRVGSARVFRYQYVGIPNAKREDPPRVVLHCSGIWPKDGWGP